MHDRDDRNAQRGALQPKLGEEGFEQSPDTVTKSQLAKAGVNVNEWPDKLGELLD